MSTLVKQPVSYGPSSAADPNEGRSYGPSFWVSASLHGMLLALLIIFTLAVQSQKDDGPKIFELVAGEGDDFSATEAPSGSEQGRAETGDITFTSPTAVPIWTPPAPEPDPAPEPVRQPAPPQVTKVAPVPEPVKATVTPPPVPVPNFTKAIKKTIQRAEQKADREIQKQRDADARAAKEKALADKRLSYSEFTKNNGSKTSPSQKTSSTAGGGTAGPRVDANGIKKGITGGTGAGSKGAGGKALTATEGAAMERYFSMLITRLRESHEKPGGLSDLLNAEVQFTIAANGAIAGVRIVRSSGNADFDQSVLEAFSRVKMPTRPDGKTDVQRLTFRIKEA
jgi:colicin import membrane protein